MRVRAHSEGLRRLESPVAVAQQDRDIAGVTNLGVRVAKVGHREVGHPIAVEVAHGHGERGVANSVGLRRLEGPVAVAQQDCDIARVRRDEVGVTRVGHGQVQLVIAVEVAHDHTVRKSAPRRDDQRRLLEGSIAVAPEHRDIVVTIVGHGQVQLAIAIEVAHDWGDHAHATREARGLLEGPVADPQEHRDVAGKPVARREVLDPITIEVARGHGGRTVANSEGLGRLEGAIAVAQQHGDSVGIDVGYRQVWLAVAIEVAHGDPHGSRAHSDG